MKIFIQHTVFISEPGLYSLIFNSKLSAAETFQDWVFSTVLPALRQTGSYTLPVTNLSITEFTVGELKDQVNKLKYPICVERGRKSGTSTQEKRRTMAKKIVELENAKVFNDAFMELCHIGLDF